MQAQNGDKESVKNLWAYAFDEQEPFLSEFFDNFWKAEDALVIKEDSTLSAALLMIPYCISLNGTSVTSAYIVGVSVAEEFRGRKFSKKLMRDCLIEQKKRNMALSFLIPFNYEFYNKLGYRLCYTLDIYELTQDNLPDKIDISPVKLARPCDFEKLNSVYNHFCRDKNGYIIRDKQDWEYIFFEQKLASGGILAVENGDTFSGYASFSEKNGEIFVRELVYKDISSLFSLLAEFKNYKKLKIRTATDKVLLKHILNPKNVLKTIPTVMARVANIEKVLSLYNISDLKFKINDDLIEENCGIYEKNGDKILRTNNDSYDVSLDIGSFTELALGFSSANELLFSNRLSADEKTIKKLIKIFPEKNNYINHIMEE